MKRTVVLPVSQAKEGRKTSALEKSLIRFLERELEVKLTRREMWRNISFFARSLAFSKRTPIFAMLNILRRRRCSPTLPLAFFMPIG